MKKECRELDSNQGSIDYQTETPESMAIADLHSWLQYVINYYNFYYTQKLPRQSYT